MTRATTGLVSHAPPAESQSCECGLVMGPHACMTLSGHQKGRNEMLLQHPLTI